MATNLLDALQDLMTPELLAAASTRLGEPESAVSTGLGAAFPLILGGLMQKANDPSTRSELMSLLTSSRRNVPDLLANPAGVLDGDPSSSGDLEVGARLLSTVMGSRSGATTAALADYAGIRRVSASSLMTLAGAMITGLLGERVRRDGLSSGGLADLLHDQRDHIAAALPGGFSSVAGVDAARAAVSRARATSVEPPEGSWGWLWAAAALLIAFGAWALWTGRRPTEIAAPSTDSIRVAQDALRRSGQSVADAAQHTGQAAGDAAHRMRQSAGDAALRVEQDFGHAAQVAGDQGQIALANLGAFTARRLPTNIELSVPERGVESSVIAYLDDPSKQLDPPVWFNFDRLLFETASATLKPASHEQLKNVAEIMKAYPTVKMKIGGYTDSTGDPVANLKLSHDRAANVRSEIIALGIAPDRLDAEGFGQQFPVADNATAEGRQQNRRIAMQVTAK